MLKPSFRDQHIRPLLYPLETVLDDSIGCAVWFAARGHGVLGNGEHQGKPIQSSARVNSILASNVYFSRFCKYYIDCSKET